jgi:hypothetical protein
MLCQCHRIRTPCSKHGYYGMAILSVRPCHTSSECDVRDTLGVSRVGELPEDKRRGIKSLLVCQRCG